MPKTWYCQNCRIHFQNSMGFFCPWCGNERISESMGSLGGVVAV